MARTTRRTFLKQGSAGAAGAAVAWAGLSSSAAGANERITLGLIGCGGRGRRVACTAAGEKDATVAYVCDPDSRRAARAAKDCAGARAVDDLRKVLDAKDVDAVIIATPDHWHAPAAILACRAGKHVYVEKPCSHNIREGRLMLDAARKHKRVMQVGTQSRSNPPVREAIAALGEGVIGEVLVAKAWNSQRRANIGHAKPSKPPSAVDYDLWVGPAPFVEYQSNRFHYTWHWWFNFGTGDIGNDGVHELDVARWGLGVTGHPVRASGCGAKLFFDDDQQFPDTYSLAYEYPPPDTGGRARMLIYEQRIWSPYRQEGYENGNAFYGTKGMMLLAKGDGVRIFGPRNKPIGDKRFKLPTAPHVRDFLDAIKAGRKPHADIEVGHGAATLTHLGNIVARVGRSVRFDPKAENVVDDAEAARLVRRRYREGHWAVPKGV